MYSMQKSSKIHRVFKSEPCGESEDRSHVFEKSAVFKEVEVETAPEGWVKVLRQS